MKDQQSRRDPDPDRRDLQRPPMDRMIRRARRRGRGLGHRVGDYSAADPRAWEQHEDPS
jgi:hypothetical protein